MTFASNLRFAVRAFAGRYPSLFYRFYGARPRNRGLSVLPGTQLVIEGFPRSANTFAVAAFSHVQPGEVKLAHHLHVPAQVIRAVRLGVPAVVLIREPREAVASMLVFDPALSPRLLLRTHIRFYETLLPYREGYVAATFEDATRHLDRVVTALNARFHTEFAVPRLTERDLREIFDGMEHHNRRVNGGLFIRSGTPSPQRNTAKQAARRRIEHGRYRELLAAAEAVYRRFVSEAAVL